MSYHIWLINKVILTSLTSKSDQTEKREKRNQLQSPLLSPIERWNEWTNIKQSFHKFILFHNYRFNSILNLIKVYLTKGAGLLQRCDSTRIQPSIDTLLAICNIYLVKNSNIDVI